MKLKLKLLVCGVLGLAMLDTLSACGQSGPLYLPDNNAHQQTASKR